MQTAIVYSRILRQMAEKKQQQDQQRAEQRLHGVAARAMPAAAAGKTTQASAQH